MLRKSLESCPSIFIYIKEVLYANFINFIYIKLDMGENALSQSDSQIFKLIISPELIDEIA